MKSKQIRRSHCEQRRALHLWGVAFLFFGFCECEQKHELIHCSTPTMTKFCETLHQPLKKFCITLVVGS